MIGYIVLIVGVWFVARQGLNLNHEHNVARRRTYEYHDGG